MSETLQSMVWRKPSFDASAPSKPPGPPLLERVRLAKLFCTMKLALRQPRQRMHRLEMVRHSARTPPDALQSQRTQYASEQRPAQRNVRWSSQIIYLQVRNSSARTC
jgi:hypothetical protein